MAEPRLAPKPTDEWDDDTRALIGDRSLNIFATLAHHPKLMKRFLVFGNHVLGKSTLAPRDRELLILRTGWNCRAPYEWGQHVAVARGSGVTDDEITGAVRILDSVLLGASTVRGINEVNQRAGTGTGF